VPLKAIVDGEPIIGPDLSEEEWRNLAVRHRKGLPVTMACCGAPGHLRVSKKGMQHFYHAVDAGCNYAEESLEHLVIKEQIYRACRAAGWETTVEFPAPDRSWIADVYAARDGRKIVFEIQISTISPDELEERDVKYRAEGIESYWILHHRMIRTSLKVPAGLLTQFPLSIIPSLRPVLKIISSLQKASGVSASVQRSRPFSQPVTRISPSRSGSGRS
jgi:hypothetical protein